MSPKDRLASLKALLQKPWRAAWACFCESARPRWAKVLRLVSRMRALQWRG